MALGSLTVFAVLGAAVVVPLAREYADLRRSAGLGRLGALATIGLLLPGLAVGVALSLPLAGRPFAQWAATALVALLLYSLAARAITANASSAATAPSRRT